jgi:DNA-binding transcriptional MocR family regulator
MRNGTLIKQVMAQVNAEIAARRYFPGMRIPSVRAQAKALGVSVSTVVEAYERLVAEGAIVSRRGAGYYVSGPVAPLALMEIGPKLDLNVDPLWVSRQSLESDQTALKPGCGWLPASWMLEEGVRRALRAQARGATLELTEYATPLGHPALRQYLARRMAEVGIEASPEQIMLTESGTQAIDLICRFLLEPGDRVLVDDPCYFNFHALLKAHQVQVIGVPYTPNGPDVEMFEAAMEMHKPRLYITNSGIHNPTGATLSPLIAHRLLKIIESNEMVVIEDDIFGDFEHTHAPRLAAFDGLSKVVHIGSFSKTVSASIRCGYIAARSEWIDGLVDLKIATAFGGGRLAADLIFKVVTSGGYRKHMESIRLRLEEEMNRVASRLQDMNIIPAILPKAGMFLWCRLPKGIDAATVARSCLSDGVVLAPGNSFSHSLSAGDFLRFNVSQCADEKVFTVLSHALGRISPLLEIN